MLESKHCLKEESVNNMRLTYKILCNRDIHNIRDEIRIKSFEKKIVYREKVVF
jgi:hypothetical protein